MGHSNLAVYMIISMLKKKSNEEKSVKIEGCLLKKWIKCNVHCDIVSKY